MDTTTDLPPVDAEGYLIEPLDWNEEVAKALASQENIVLTPDHWDVLNFMREYYAESRLFTSILTTLHRSSGQLQP